MINIKTYLKNKNITFDTDNKNDNYNLFIKKLNDVYYVECHYILYPMNYKMENNKYICTNNFPSYRFICGKDGNIIIDLEEIIPSNYLDNVVVLDDYNVIIPVKRYDKNYYQHFIIKDNEARLINIFDCMPNTNKNLLKYKLIMIKDKLYNFELGIILNDYYNENKVKNLNKNK